MRRMCARPWKAGRIVCLMYTYPMKILGIDPGYGRCGMAVVERSDGNDILLYSDCIETSASDEFPLRLSQIIDECARLLKAHEPDAFAIEKLYFANNQKTAMRVAEVRGALISCAIQHGVEVFEYTPAQVKSAVAGLRRRRQKADRHDADDIAEDRKRNQA